MHTTKFSKTIQHLSFLEQVLRSVFLFSLPTKYLIQLIQTKDSFLFRTGQSLLYFQPI